MSKGKKFETAARPSAIEVLKSWCLIEAWYTSRMMPPVKNGEPCPDARDSDVRNFQIAERVLRQSSRRRQIVFHVVDRGLRAETFRLYDSPVPPRLPHELTELGLTHELLAIAAFRALLADLDKVIQSTPPPLKLVPIDKEQAQVPESHRFPLNPAMDRAV